MVKTEKSSVVSTMINGIKTYKPELRDFIKTTKEYREAVQIRHSELIKSIKIEDDGFYGTWEEFICIK